MARRKSRQFKNKKVKDTPFNERWNKYFDTRLAKHRADAGHYWIKLHEKRTGTQYSIYSSKTAQDERDAITEWFTNHFRKMSLISLWMMENGTCYIINKKTKIVYHIKLHPRIVREYLRKYPNGRGNYLSRVWSNGKENEYASGGHLTFFYDANLFFFNELGYKFEVVDVAPGWWYNIGAAAVAADVRSRIAAGKTEITEYIDSMMSGNENNANRSNAILQAIALAKVQYREDEINRIIQRYERILSLEYPNPHDAVLHTDSYGRAWSDYTGATGRVLGTLAVPNRASEATGIPVTQDGMTDWVKNHPLIGEELRQELEQE